MPPAWADGFFLTTESPGKPRLLALLSPTPPHNAEKEAPGPGSSDHSSPLLPTPSLGCYLPCCAGHSQVAAVFAEENLLDAQPRIVTIGVKGAHLPRERRSREWPSALGLTRPHTPWGPSSGPHLAEGWPLFLALGTEALVGVCVGEEHPHGAEFVEQPQADARGVPEPHRAILMPVGGTRLPPVRGLPGRHISSNYQHPLDHGKSKRVPEKHLFLLY